MKSFSKLCIPIGLETLCYMLAGMVDTVMLSTVSDSAGGAVGTANTYINVFIIMFNVVASGMIAVMTQYIGAGKPGIAYQAMQLGAAFNAILGILLSLFLGIFSGSILEIVGVAPLLMEHADTYLQIVGGGCVLNALIPIFSSYLRAFGYTKQPLAATLLSNGANLGLNALFLFVFQGGVAGVAAAINILERLFHHITKYSSHVLSLSFCRLHAPCPCGQGEGQNEKKGGLWADFKNRTALRPGERALQRRSDADHPLYEPDG